MSHPPSSPDQPSSEDVPGPLDVVQPPQDTFCAPVPPLQQPVPLPSVSPKSSVPASTMSTSLQEYAPSTERTLPGVNPMDNSGYQWGTYNDLSCNRMDQDGNGFGMPSQYLPNSTTHYGYNQNFVHYTGNRDLDHSFASHWSSPRTYSTALDLTALPVDFNNYYPPTAFQLEPQRNFESPDLGDQGINDQLMQQRQDYIPYHPNFEHESYPGASESSTYDSDATRSSTPDGESPTPPHKDRLDSGEEVAIDKEQPYAQLIFRALKEAPHHTMVLKDIYNWFRVNTEKASDSEAKGWQNSIRHNLSMNGAFEKVGQPGDSDLKKGYMWRLTPEAIRDGVKSTTRYRSKQPNKRGRGSRLPLPQRQASGAKGGQAARRSAKMRQQGGLPRSEPCRSVPSGPDMGPDLNAPYHPVYYMSPAETNLEFPRDGNFGSVMSTPNMDLYNSHLYAGTPLPQPPPLPPRQNIMYDDASSFADMPPIHPMEPVYTNSPSPTLDEPRTPDSPGTGWANDVAMRAHNGGEYHNSEYIFDMPETKFPI